MVERRSGSDRPGGFTVDELVARVIRSGAVSEVRRARLVTDGLQHLIVILDDELVARFPRDDNAMKSIQDEAMLLMHLAERVTVPLPVPVYMGESFALHRMLHGAVTSRHALGSLQRGARERILDDVGQFLAELGGAAAPAFATSAATTSVDRLRALRRRADGLVVPLLSSHQREWLEELFASIETASFVNTPSLIHGDLAPYHVLHDPESGELTGVLDFGVAGLGDPAVDLGCLLSVWGERFAGQLARRWPAAVEFVDRARLLAMALPLEWAVIALETNAADMVVAHLGHSAVDVAPLGTPFGPAPPTGVRSHPVLEGSA
jgi:aminoglycoside 2''-phosphotransferase